jgi:hypothetical protein
MQLWYALSSRSYGILIEMYELYRTFIIWTGNRKVLIPLALIYWVSIGTQRLFVCLC